MKNFIHAINQPYGLFLITGPTGSGKTITLYTALNILNSPQFNISTAEDPVEITLPGINQVNMNPKAGIDFATALRAFLRQDPDVIMVGEIRDQETAEPPYSNENPSLQYYFINTINCCSTTNP
jgi:type IV pilus assembly protein PilB